jgi:hypothetical protein
MALAIMPLWIPDRALGQRLKNQSLAWKDNPFKIPV